ncbi:hypothetical protein RIR_e17709_A0A2N1NR24_9GLOM [Rhizophagus irregularis DAOM 181602=DAOM 197198]|uniref:Uncharacterized protein n=1 Tax=Rhizophagus irregularis TaxID=588596 RepID=A0A2N1NR24_9GLOM|nr:hypothetical protein RhiirC2_174700 [Rhizophagus irregularis]GET52128.1 hypothetical protein RIR_e17709_A0A2N1NR24_9GLOM [Rhizophagus irregularis DAOM 181602=DAOM 197198]
MYHVIAKLSSLRNSCLPPNHYMSISRIYFVFLFAPTKYLVSYGFNLNRKKINIFF